MFWGTSTWMLVADQERTQVPSSPCRHPIHLLAELLYKLPAPLSSPHPLTHKSLYNDFCPHPVLLLYPHALPPACFPSGRRPVRGQLSPSRCCRVSADHHSCDSWLVSRMPWNLSPGLFMIRIRFPIQRLIVRPHLQPLPSHWSIREVQLHRPHMLPPRCLCVCSVV